MEASKIGRTFSSLSKKSTFSKTNSECPSIKLTGKKWRDKKYVSYSGYPGGQKITTPLEIKDKKSSKFIVEKAVKGMLPKNRLGRQLFRNLFVYEDSKHPHESQKPKEIKI